MTETVLKDQMTDLEKDKPILTTALIGKLEDCKTVLDCVSDEQYQKMIPYKAAAHKTHSAAGQHMRHVLEFIQTLLDSRESGLVNYDARQRKIEVENDRGVAAAMIEDLKARLLTITSQDLEMPMKAHEAVAVEHDIEPQVSSFGRELLFAIAHTEHHFALISSQCDEMGVVLPDNFGKAISTLCHELSLKS